MGGGFGGGGHMGGGFGGGGHMGGGAIGGARSAGLGLRGGEFGVGAHFGGGGHHFDGSFDHGNHGAISAVDLVMAATASFSAEATACSRTIITAMATAAGRPNAPRRRTLAHAAGLYLRLTLRDQDELRKACGASSPSLPQ